jgi:hypothetical protein
MGNGFRRGDCRSLDGAVKGKNAEEFESTSENDPKKSQPGFADWLF